MTKRILHCVSAGRWTRIKDGERISDAASRLVARTEGRDFFAITTPHTIPFSHGFEFTCEVVRHVGGMTEHSGVFYLFRMREA